MKRLLIGCMLLFQTGMLSAQQTLSLDAFLAIVKKYHPVSKQAALGIAMAKADVLSARGAFDPVLHMETSRKEFDGLLYYNHQVGELKIPTWYGVEVVAGIESLQGERTSTPDTKGNTSFIGFNIPLAKGILMDERRAVLQQAGLMQQMALQEQQALLNDLLYDAITAYWNWWQQVAAQQLFRQAIINAGQRFQFVKTAHRFGERPAIDTVEALAQLQTFEIQAKELELAVTNAGLAVSAFLWKEDGAPYTLPAFVIPQDSLHAHEIILAQLMQQAGAHPKLQQFGYKLKALQLDKKLRFQSLLPQVNLKYRQLNASHNLGESFHNPWLENNYRYGLTIALPLRLSEGRGGYQKAKLKLQEVEWQRLHAQMLLQVKLQQYYNEWYQLQQQIALQQKALQSYTTLQKGELLLFNNGESSLFLVNTRELKTIEAAQKLIALRSKAQKALAGALWAAGTLPGQ